MNNSLFTKLEDWLKSQGLLFYDEFAYHFPSVPKLNLGPFAALKVFTDDKVVPKYIRIIGSYSYNNIGEITYVTECGIAISRWSDCSLYTLETDEDYDKIVNQINFLHKKYKECIINEKR